MGTPFIKGLADLWFNLQPEKLLNMFRVWPQTKKNVYIVAATDWL